MHVTPQADHIPLMTRPMVIVMAIIIAIGALFTTWMVVYADRCRRDGVLDQARRIVETIRLERVQALSGTAADLTTPIYQRLKSQLADARAATPGCAFIYLMGRRNDGTIVFLVDSEPVGSDNESPAGQVYTEITDEDRRAFTETIATVSGPATDRWGTWISALVPLVEPQNDALVAVLGMDFAADDWHWQQLRAALPPLLLTMAMMGLLIIGAILIDRRLPTTERSRNQPAYRDILLAIVVIGMFISLLSGWVLGEQVAGRRRQAFRQLAHDKSAVIAKTLHTLQFTELAALGRLFSASEYVSQKEFADYSDYLVKNPVIDTWAWVRRVPAAQLEALERQIRAESLPDFFIWQRAGDGRQIPARGRTDYYPVLRAVPDRKSQTIIGFDLGSDPLCRHALQAALASGLTTCTDSIAGVAQRPSPIIQVYHPVFAEDDTSPRQGFARADIRPDLLLSSVRPNDLVGIELALGRPEASPESLAVS